MGMRGDSVHLETFWGGILSGVTVSGGFCPGGFCPGGIMPVPPKYQSRQNTMHDTILSGFI